MITRSLKAIVTVLALVAFAPLATFAAEEEIIFRGQKIYVDGVTEKKWIGNPSAANAELILIYKGSTGSFRTLNNVEARVLAIGGGGAGGTVRSSSYTTHSGGGGGGAGEFVDRSNVIFLSGDAYQLTIGAGGQPQGSSSTAKAGQNGEDSVIARGGEDYIRVKGGGGGGGESKGATGGSGGGGSYKSKTVYQGGDASCASPDYGKANKGADAITRYGGGGGGAAAEGGVGDATSGAQHGGNGGDGVESDIDPENVRCYAGGGGGGNTDSGTGGTGGSGGGGTGAMAGNNDLSLSTPGEANTGSGGGGGGRYKPGSAGGSGIIIIRLTYIDVPLVWNSIDLFDNGKIFVTEGVEYWRVNPSDPHSDVIIKYTNPDVRGGLRFYDPENPTLPAVWANARVLVVGGGGGGGFVDVQRRGGGAGGGAGGFVETGTDGKLVFSTNFEYAVEVGAGGEGGSRSDMPGGNGGNSVVKTTAGVISEAFGGGGGGARSVGADGGSGGGGSMAESGEKQDGGSGTSGQGFDGGKGLIAYAGAGGGGAASVGGDAVANAIGEPVAGVGGQGQQSNITGENLWYAAGGGGAVVNASRATTWFRGGKGGSGIGGDGAGAEGAAEGYADAVAIPATPGVDGTGSGGGGGTSYAGCTIPAGAGGSGVVIIRLSGFVVGSVPLPEAKGPFTYDGNSHTGVVEFFAYEFVTNKDDRTTWPVGVDADNYVVKVNISQQLPANVQWKTGGRDPKYVHWTIKPHSVEIPKANDESFVFTVSGGTTGDTVMKNACTNADAKGWCWVKLADDGTNVHFCTVSDHIRGDAGDYEFNCKLNNDYESEPNVTNFYWKLPWEDSPLADQKVPWTIRQAANRITSLSIPDWQEGTTNTSPTCHWTWETIAAGYGPTGIVDRVKYKWRAADETWGDQDYQLWEDLEMPTKAGVYYVKAYICKDSNHEPGNWVEAASEDTRFCIWRHPSKTLADWMDMTFTYSSTRYITVSLRDVGRNTSTGAVNTGYPGFAYADVIGNGNQAEIRFVAISNIVESKVADCDKGNPLARDELLPFDASAWTRTGVSTVRVKMPPSNATTIRMYWRRRPGVAAILEDKLASEVTGTSGYTATGKLVNQLQGIGEDGKDVRAWVNYWVTEPTVTRYVEVDKLNTTDIKSGALKTGTIDVEYRLMPPGTPKDFEYVRTNCGPYTVNFAMNAREMKEGTTAYPGPHVYFDGDRTRDLDIYKDRPEPIDPTEDPDVTNLRVLLANDDLGPAEQSAVSNQSYFAWKHEDDGFVPPTVMTNGTSVITNNLRGAGATHALTNSLGVTLWTLNGIHLGNMMSKDLTTAKPLLSDQYSLPWSGTSLNSTDDPADRAAPLNRRGVGQMVMRNWAGESTPAFDSDGAAVESPWYADGIGTVYFDAVNAFKTTPSSTSYRLQVEISTNAFDKMSLTQKSNSVWEVVKNVTVLKFTSTGNGTKQTGGADGVISLTSSTSKTNGSTNEFFRVIAPVPAAIHHRPMRFRIRRVSALNGAEDNWKGFIILDNVIASWPAKDVDLHPCGWYDGTKHGKRTLGWEMAFTPAYPSATATNLYMRARFDGDSQTALSARCYYRWRYLDALPEADWQVMYLDTKNVYSGNEYRSVKPLQMSGLPGDIEYWFDMTAIIPYCRYVDYTGSSRTKPTGDYTEEPEKGVTSTREKETGETTILPSHGKDWFVRLRDGESDLEAIRAYFRYKERDEDGDETPAEATVDLFLVGDHVWRGFLRTSREMAGQAADYRFETFAPVAPESASPQLATNFYVASESVTDPERIPASLKLMEAAPGAWRQVWIDSATGHLMMQYDDRTATLTVAHADHQDFNGWSDAVGHDDPPYFTGSSIEGPKRSGASSRMKRLSHSFDRWYDTPETKPEWHEGFLGELDVGYPGYKPFASADTPNGWLANNGQWTGRFYHPVDGDSRAVSGLALELFGAQNGNMQLINPAESPRGVGALTFTARVAQPIDWACFVLSEDKASPEKDNDYAFTTLATFDTAQNRNFAGSASLSLVACYSENYRTGFGFYEARWEQLKGEWDKDKGSFKNPDRMSQRLALYRWMPGAGGDLEPEELGAITNKMFSIPQTSGLNGNYMPFFISAVTDASGNTTVSAGVLRKNDGVSPTMTFPPTDKWVAFCYVDTKKGHPTAGSYGLLSANCEAVFLRPTIWTSHATVQDAKTTANAFQGLDNKSVTFNGTATECNHRGEPTCWWRWTLDGERMIDFYSLSEFTSIKNGVIPPVPMSVDETYWGIMARTPSTQLELYLGTKGKDDWKLVDTATVSGFGTNEKAGEKRTFYVRSVNDSSIKLAVAAAAEKDVVLTDVSFDQWRGDTFGLDDSDTRSYPDFPGDGVMTRTGCPTNFVFTSGQVVTNPANGYAHMVKLSAKRTAAGYPSSIRAPLFDGSSGRGVGLGMISFSYANAQANVNLLVQIATNANDITTARLYNTTVSTDTNTVWNTVTNFSFAGCSADELQNGVRSAYLGLHGVKGVMRIVLDPALVEYVQTNKATSGASAATELFGEIDITKIVCRDEPTLDESDWWGWNVRTVEGAGNSVGDYRRTYLPDGDLDAEGAGLPIALNNSVTADVREEDQTPVGYNLPFVQTPTFTDKIVGEVSFRARRYDNGENSQYAEVHVYGANTPDAKNWKLLTTTASGEPAPIVVSNLVYETFSFRSTENCTAFRLVVTGLDGLAPGVNRGPSGKYGPPVRVLIDEVAVFQAVHPMMGFRYVYPFRDDIEGTAMCTNVVDAAGNPLPEAQPLNGESWTVQAEVEKSQLPDEIDVKVHPPRVIFHWYVGTQPWGYANWRDLKGADGAHTAELAPADGTNLVFRGSLVNARDAVVGVVPAKHQTVVQYAADVIFRTVSGQEITNSLVRGVSTTTWKRPYWYAPVDYNEQYAARTGSAAAFTIIDTIAPHRVWINEVNLWDGRDRNLSPLAKTNQWVEIAAPERQSLDGWRLDYIANDFTTNTLCRFSDTLTYSGYVPAKKDLSKVPAGSRNAYRTNDYVFIAVQSPKTRDARVWNKVPAAIDGTWSDFDTYGGVLNYQEPMALRLVRPSNVVEQEIVLEGTNIYATGRYAGRNSATNWIAQIERTMPGGASQFYYVGNEYANRGDQSIGVIRGTGSVSNEWTNLMVQTPGRVNEGQIVPFGYVLYPNGELMFIRAQIGPSGHILQGLPGEPLSADELTFMVKKGGPGTNITYSVANWWETAFVTTNGNLVAESVGKRGTWTLKNVGAGMSNDVTVVANAQPFTELREKYGLTDANPYTSAVMDWLEGGRDYFDKEFEHPGEIHLAAFKTPIGYEFVTNLDLTAMYWLDIDPTVSNWVLRAGVTGFTPISTNRLDGTPLTHARLKYHMEITNETSHVAYAPYILRGLQPKVTTANYSGSWTSETFKVTADLQNGVETRTRWVPLRWFLFIPKPGASSRIGASASFDDGFNALVDIWDPKDENHALPWTRGWSQYPDASIWYRWAIDDRGAPISIEPLKPDSTLFD